jgi:hypothetical protein
MSETPATPATDDVEAHRAFAQWDAKNDETSTTDDVEAHGFRAWDATTDEAGTDADDVEAHLRRNVHTTGGGEGDGDVQKHLRSN